jgi:hypothetical protein
MKPALLTLGLMGVSVLAGCGDSDSPGETPAVGSVRAASGGGSVGGAAGSRITGGAPGAGAGGVGAAEIDAEVRSPDSGEHSSSGGGSAAEGGASGPDAAAGADYACSLILGILTTSEWFGGFEKIVDDARWELKFQDSAHLEKWADPSNAVWSLPITSPCAEKADAPDRVVFMGTNYDYDTVDAFLPKYVAVLNNVRTKYPSVRRVDVMTYTRAPGNVECTGAERSAYSHIKPAQDEAIARLTETYPGFVFAAPKWEVQSCSDFGLCPHLKGPANAAISRTIGEYFLSH